MSCPSTNKQHQTQKQHADTYIDRIHLPNAISSRLYIDFQPDDGISIIFQLDANHIYSSD